MGKSETNLIFFILLQEKKKFIKFVVQLREVYIFLTVSNERAQQLLCTEKFRPR